jgi:transcription elongation factor Elf1
VPYDPHGAEEEEDRDQAAASEGRQRRFGDFDCPACNANNPYDDGFGDGDEVLCYYCGQEFKVVVTDEGRLRLKEA